MTSQPTEPPTSGPAVEQPPHRLDDLPRTTVYPRPNQPSLWVFWPDRWVHATVIARQDYQDGRVVYQVEVSSEGSTVIKTFAWGPDSVRPA